MIALGLFSAGLLAVVTLLPVGQRSVRRVVTATAAAAIAERELSRIRVEYGAGEKPPPARLSGVDAASGYRWEALIEGSGIYSVTLAVYWDQKGEEKSEIFITRFVARPPARLENGAQKDPAPRK